MTIRRFFLTLVLVILGNTVSIGVYAQGFGFLDESVLEALNDDELASFKALIRQTLNAAPDSEVIDWQSPDGSKAGKILPRFSYETNDTVCRRSVFQVSEVDGRSENYRFDLCQQGDNWVIAEAPATLSRAEREQLEEFLIAALEQQEDGLPLSWTGSRSGHNAVIVPIATGSEVSANCRLTAITVIDRDGQALNGQYQFCKNNEAEWEYQPE